MNGQVSRPELGLRREGEVREEGVREEGVREEGVEVFSVAALCGSQYVERSQQMDCSAVPRRTQADLSSSPLFFSQIGRAHV